MLLGTCHGYKILSTNARLVDVLNNTVSSHGGYGDEAATKAIMMLFAIDATET
jgi:class 3 adenylate cyclase